MGTRTVSKFFIIGALGASTWLAGCFDSASESAAPSPTGKAANQEDEAGPKIETSTGGLFTKGLEEKSSQPLPKSIQQGAAAKTASGSAWVGFPSKDPNNANAPCAYRTLFRFDDEDGRDNNNQLVWNGVNWSHRNAWVGGLGHSSSPWIAGGNTEVHSCQEYVTSLPTLSFDYAVFKYSSSCPDNSVSFGRRLDNEDGNNSNKAYGYPSPSVVSSASNGYSWIYFCFVPGQAGYPSTPPSNWTDKYMLFSNGSPTASLKGYLYDDDEDNANNNGYVSDNANLTTRMQALISGGSNTRWNFASWGAYPDLQDKGGDTGFWGCIFTAGPWDYTCFD